MAMELEVGGRLVFAGTGESSLVRERRTVLLLHGAGQDHSVFDAVAVLLARAGLAPVAPDLPGHGRSTGPAPATVEEAGRWVIDLLDTLGVAHALIAGHSMGALIALECAARASERVSGLVLTGPAASMAVNSELLRAADARDPRAAAMVSGWTHTGVGDPSATGSWMPTDTERLLRQELGTLAGDLRACAGFDAGTRALAVRCPVTVVIAGRDRMTPPQGGEALSALLADVEVVRLPDAGHHVPGEHPEDLAQAVILRGDD